MGLFDKAREALENATKSVEQAAKSIDLSQITGKVGDAAKSVGDAIQGIIPNQGKENIPAPADSEEPEAVEGPANEEPKAVVPEVVKPPEMKAISTHSALKIFYYMMSADGMILHNEEEKFDSIGNELDPNYAEHKDAIIAECKAHLGTVIDPEEYYDVVQDGVGEAIATSVPTDDSFITPKLLAWDALSLAYSDENYDETERKLLKYIVRKTNIDRAVFLEMESSMHTLMDIEREIAWVKTTNQPYLTIEGVLNELAERKTVIMDSVRDLITL